MGKIIYRLLLTAVLLTLTLALMGCKSGDKDSAAEQEATPAPTEELPAATPASAEEQGTNPGDLSQIRFYTVDVDTYELKKAVGMVSAQDEITPATVLGFLTDSLEDESVEVDIDSAYVTEGYCIVSFTDSICSVAEDDPLLEEAILDAAAQSILDNIEDCRGGIIFRINGYLYDTVNNHFGINEIYMD